MNVTDAEAERLTILMEECGEVIQACAKILRHGFESDGYDNRGDLEREIGDLVYVTGLVVSTDLKIENSMKASEEKDKSIWQYLHYNERNINEENESI